MQSLSGSETLVAMLSLRSPTRVVSWFIGQTIDRAGRMGSSLRANSSWVPGFKMTNPHRPDQRGLLAEQGLRWRTRNLLRGK